MVDRTRSITYEAYDRNVFSKKKFRNAPNAIQCHVKRKDKSHDVNRKAFRFNVKAPICCWCVYFLEVENVSLKDSSLRLGAAKWIQNDREIVLKWIYSHLLLNLNIFIYSSSLSFHFPQSHNASVALLPNNWCDLPSAHSISFHLFLFALSLALAELWCWLWLTKINCSRSHLFGCVYVRKMENRSLCRLLSEDSQMIFSCSGIYIYTSLEFRTVVFLGECIERLFTQNCICIVHITASVFVWISNWKAVGRLVCYASSCCCCWFGLLLLLLSDDWLPFFLSIHICELTVLPLNRIAQQTTTVPLVYREHSCDIDVLWIWRTSKFHSLTLCFDTIIWISKREHCYREISVERQ